MTTSECRAAIESGALDERFAALYPSVPQARERYLTCLARHEERYGPQEEIFFFSTPGRTEIGGNHTDHQNGTVLAGAVSLDLVAAVSRNSSHTVRIESEGYPADSLDLADLSPKDDEKNHSSSLIRGVLAKIREKGYLVSGFDAYTMSDVLRGSGLSSSAAFEVSIAGIANSLFCGDTLSPVELAQIAQYAENIYFGKPSGLMDQTACAVGGCVKIDFQDPEKPLLETVSFDLSKDGYQLVIVNCGGNHADLTDDYAAIPAEMKEVAGSFGKNRLRDVAPADFFQELPSLRKKCGDRAVLRAVHFFHENERASLLTEAIRQGDLSRFFQLVQASGRSSYELLQNIYSEKHPREQDLAVALCLTERLLHGEGACRVHGGGFAGTIQAYVPQALLPELVASLEAVFGKGCCQILNIRQEGSIRIL